MKKYFADKIKNTKFTVVEEAEIIIYRQNLIEYLTSMGATNKDLELVSNEMILNAIRNNRKPEDVAWAILQ